MSSYLQTLQKEKPTILGGDLNVAHLDIDIWNVDAKHISKTPGTTPEERASFTQFLQCGYKDAFRTLHPLASGCYTYWSVRAGNRSVVIKKEVAFL